MSLASLSRKHVAGLERVLVVRLRLPLLPSEKPLFESLELPSHAAPTRPALRHILIYGMRIIPKGSDVIRELIAAIRDN